MIRSAHQTVEEWPRRTLRAATPYYELSRHRSRKAILAPRPEALRHLDRIDQKVWKQYQTHLGRISPLERAEFYGRHMRERGLRSANDTRSPDPLFRIRPFPHPGLALGLGNDGIDVIGAVLASARSWLGSRFPPVGMEPRFDFIRIEKINGANPPKKEGHAYHKNQ